MDRLRESFEEITGAAPAGAWRAPGRVNLIGEHTDYSGGLALPFAIDLGVSVAVGRRADGLLAMHSLQLPEEAVTVALGELHPGHPGNWAAYPAGVVQMVLDRDVAIGGLDLVVDSNIPTGAGLSSSAALTCAVAIACADLYGLDLAANSLAELARRAEAEFVGVPVGILDQMASLRSRKGHALLLDARSLFVDHVPLDLDAAGLALLVIDTREPHRLTDSVYAERHEACRRAAASLGLRSLRDLDLDGLDAAAIRLDDPLLARRAGHVVSENARVIEAAALLRSGDVAAVGPLLSASHASLRDDYEVSSRGLDVAVSGALRGGALGARMTGAGFGGSAIALVAADDLDAVTRAVRDEFRRLDAMEPRLFSVTPSPGARRLY